jgi:hypothetical protein
MKRAYKHMIPYCRLVLILLCCYNSAHAQTLSQKISGFVTDAESKTPLISATVVVVNHNELSSFTDENGRFVIQNVPVGRQTLQVSLMGYETKTLSEVLVTSGKELMLNISLTESLTELKEVVISGNKNRSRALNEFASVSARSFSVEDTKRYPAAVSDPGRMVMNFAGVSTADDGENGIVVRGNSPKGILWRLEGIEIPNPNHFSLLGTSGGAISMLSASTLSNSDFYTGAFPAEIGNALAGAFDLNFRNGNTDRREHSFIIGTLGIEASTEGPFKKGGKSSYLINYRYSTLALLIGFFDLGGVLPDYQDLSFKFNFPTKQFGTFGVFGLGGYNRAFKDPEKDSSKWTDDSPNFTLDNRGMMGVGGITHQYFLNPNSYIRTVLAASYDDLNQSVDTLNPTLKYLRIPIDRTGFTNRAIRGSVLYNQKINNRNTFRAGIVAQRLSYDLSERYFDNGDGIWKEILDERGGTEFYQAYVQLKSRLADRITVIGGLHGSYFALNGKYSIEPRASVSYKIKEESSITLAAGLHSKPEHISTYLFKYDSRGYSGYPNKDLDLLRAAHTVLGYDMLLPWKLRFKAEAYYQYLYNIPVEKDSASGFSIINAENVFSLINTNPLVSTGTGKNYGLDLTLERPFINNYYVLATGSIFKSEYTAYNGATYSSYYNRGYQANLVGGKEWNLNAGAKSILGLNGKVVGSGGLRQSEIDLAASQAARRQVIVPGGYYTSNGPAYFRADASIYYKLNRKRSTHTLGLDVQNVTNRRNYFFSFYDVRSGSIKTVYQLGLVPNISYRVEFH